MLKPLPPEPLPTDYAQALRSLAHAIRSGADDVDTLGVLPTQVDYRDRTVSGLRGVAGLIELLANIQEQKNG